jgi:hypothetical protein
MKTIEEFQQYFEKDMRPEMDCEQKHSPDLIYHFDIVAFMGFSWCSRSKISKPEYFSLFWYCHRNHHHSFFCALAPVGTR